MATHARLEKVRACDGGVVPGARRPRPSAGVTAAGLRRSGEARQAPPGSDVAGAEVLGDEASGMREMERAAA